MTVAVDIKTGRVIGQVTSLRRPSIPEMLGLPAGPHLTLLCRNGEYLTVPRASVRLEKV